MRTVFAPLAEADLDEIADYIAADNPARALSFTRELRERCAKIASTPRTYPLRPTIAPDIRAAPFGNYLIFYSERADHVLIERILHGARDIEGMF